MAGIVLLAFMLILSILMAVQCSSGGEGGVDTAPGSPARKRTKRFLMIREKQRFLCRMNVRDTIVANPWAHGYGFRANFDYYRTDHRLPFDYRLTDYKVEKRDVHEKIESMIDYHGLDGRSCVTKMFCDIASVPDEEAGIFFKILKLIFSNQTRYEEERNVSTAPLPLLTPLDCSTADKFCPFSVLDLSPYTDTAI